MGLFFMKKIPRKRFPCFESFFSHVRMTTVIDFPERHAKKKREKKTRRGGGKKRDRQRAGSGGGPPAARAAPAPWRLWRAPPRAPRARGPRSCVLFFFRARRTADSRKGRKTAGFNTKSYNHLSNAYAEILARTSPPAASRNKAAI